MVYTIEQLKEKAAPYLKDADKVLVTEDGHVFSQDASSFANAHARQVGVKVIPISKDEEKVVEPVKEVENAEKVVKRTKKQNDE